MILAGGRIELGVDGFIAKPAVSREPLPNHDFLE